MKKIMFICTGNICRSAMAHKMLEKYAKEKSKEVTVYSCGVFAQNGDKPTYDAINIMKEYNVDLATHRATNIRQANIEEMDIILCATKAHSLQVISMYPQMQDKIFTMKEYADFENGDLDIKDPWGMNSEVYRKCASEIKACIDKYMDKI